jgi:class 3 adenylate cyclase/tetratricopeptide (TPR) repeat protein
VEPRRERKVVTVLFADLVGFTARAETLDPEDVDAVLRPYHERLRAELERWGGTVEKFIGDAVVAVFGAPRAREDDPERAVRAALAIRDWACEEHDVEVRIAVNTGEALVSLDARPEAGEGIVTGDVVNTASRLQSAAPVNGILVGTQTHGATRDLIDYREAEPVSAKGKAEPVPVWEALEARSRFGVDVRQHGGAPLVGRVRELDVLTSALERVKQEASPQLLTVVGVPGIGKSRLVWELFTSIEQGEDLVRWRQGRSLPYGEGVSFWALAEMIKAHAGILESDAPDTAEDKLAAVVSEVVGEADGEWVLTHLRPLVGVAGDADLAGDRRDEAFAAWRRFFEALAERRPLVLVFEDLHFADDGVLDFVDHLSEWATDVPLLILCTARPELLDRRAGWGGGKLNATTLNLAALSDNDAARLVGALMERRLLPAETQVALLERAGGNPLYAEQFARLYAERESIEDLPLPDSLHGLIAARLDALPTEEKELLQDAAVLGKVFWTGALRRSPDATRTLLHALERKEFVRRERRPSVEGQDEYAFRHLLVRDVAYGQIPRAERAQRHRFAAEWIDSLGRPDDHAELRAHHYLAAIELTRAAGSDLDELSIPARRALHAAGDRSFALSAFAAALGFYEEALVLTPEDAAERPALLFARARVAHFSGRADATELLREASARLLESGDRARAAEAELTLAEAVWQQRDAEGTFEHVERGLELVSEEQPSASKASVLAQAARFNMLRGELRRTVEIGREALEIAEALDLEDVQAQVLTTVGAARFRAGDLDGLRDAEAAVELGRRIGSPDLARALINLGVILTDLAQLDRALDAQDEARHVADRIGHEFQRRFLRGARGGGFWFRGQWDEALAHAEAFIAESAASPHYLEGGNLRVRAEIKFARDDTEGALADGERAAAIARAALDPQAIFPSLFLHCDLLFRAGRTERARDVSAEIVERLDAGLQPSNVPLPHFVPALAELMGPETVRRLMATLPNTPWRRAVNAVLDDDPAAAAEICGEHGMLPEEALMRLGAAEKLVREGRRNEADVQLDRALTLFRSMGATRYVREAEALLTAIA